MSLRTGSDKSKRRFERQQMRQAARFRFTNEAPQDGIITDFSVTGLHLKVAATARPIHRVPLERSRMMIAFKFKNKILKFFGLVTRHTLGVSGRQVHQL
jgi:hypothetical protein